MGGGVMRTAAKVAGTGVVNLGVRGGGAGFSAVPSAAEQSMLKGGASRPVSAAIASVPHPIGGDDVAIVERPAWELDDWEFAGVEEDLVKPGGGGGETISRVVFGGAPTLQEAKDATDDLKDAINKVYLSSPESSTAEGSVVAGPVSKVFRSTQSSDGKASTFVESWVSPVPGAALQAFAFLSESPAAQSVVASVASDPKVWTAVMENQDLVKFLESNKIGVDMQQDGLLRDEYDEAANATQFEDTEKPVNPFSDLLQDVKLKVVQVVNNVSSYFQDLLGFSPDKENHKTADGQAKSSIFTDARTIFGLAVIVILVAVLKRA